MSSARPSPYHHAAHAGYWLLAFLFWLVVTRHHHPHWPLRVLATLTLVTVSAGFAAFCWPQRWRPGAVAISLLQLVLAGTLAAAIIHGLYDSLWGAHPLRYPFWQNVLMDAAFVAMNACLAIAVETGWRALWPGSASPLASSPAHRREEP